MADSQPNRSNAPFGSMTLRQTVFDDPDCDQKDRKDARYKLVLELHSELLKLSFAQLDEREASLETARDRIEAELRKAEAKYHALRKQIRDRNKFIEIAKKAGKIDMETKKQVLTLNEDIRTSMMEGVEMTDQMKTELTAEEGLRRGIQGMKDDNYRQQSRDAKRKQNDVPPVADKEPSVRTHCTYQFKNMSAAPSKRSRMIMFAQQQSLLWRDEGYQVQLRGEIQAMEEDMEKEYDEETTAGIAYLSDVKDVVDRLTRTKVSHDVLPVELSELLSEFGDLEDFCDIMEAFGSHRQEY